MSESLLAEVIGSGTHNPSSEIQNNPRVFLDDISTQQPYGLQNLPDETPTPRGPDIQAPSEDTLILDRLKKLEAELAEERRLHNQTHQELDQFKKLEAELAEEKQLHSQTYQELERNRQALAETHKRWKDTVKEFNQFQAQTQKFIQLDDQVLVQKASQLRFNIRNTALKHFAEERIVPDGNAAPRMLVYEPHKRSMLVQAALWAYLTTSILSQSRWAGDTVSGAFQQFGDKIGPLEDRIWPRTLDEDQVEEGRKYATWKASTTALLVQAMGLDRNNGHELRLRFAEEKAKKVSSYLRCLSASKTEHLETAIRDIIMEALELDLLISRQIAHVDWISARQMEDTWHFRPDFMEPDGNADRYMNLVLAPGLAKSGKSDGEDFGTTVLLLKMQVSCGPVDVRQQGTSQGTSEGTSQGTHTQKESFWGRNIISSGKHRRH
ncbi:hypothetical protein ONZ43_g2643 [Nemania bipapillata]|uniref:Uncharacterized protein n=1 Tax=Nemania bipapillata TaxID=110536 RepID=A0ACC2IZR9_9PEZI|nr:hypothetical protein ONZ43_g2643 [Nemania bipapillata]